MEGSQGLESYIPMLCVSIGRECTGFYCMGRKDALFYQARMLVMFGLYESAKVLYRIIWVSSIDVKDIS